MRWSGSHFSGRFCTISFGGQIDHLQVFPGRPLSRENAMSLRLDRGEKSQLSSAVGPNGQAISYLEHGPGTNALTVVTGTKSGIGIRRTE